MPSSVLDEIYGLKTPPRLTLEDVPLGKSTEELLLSKAKVDELARQFNDNEIGILGNRAITQITKQLDGGAKEGRVDKTRLKEADTQNKEK